MNHTCVSSVNKRIGIIGGGQLGKMMILEAKRLGFYITVLDPSADCPARSICDELIVAGFDDDEAYFELAKKADVITYEFEHINIKALEILEREGRAIYPSIKSLKTIQNKYLQNKTLEENGIPTPRFAKVASVEDIREMGKPGRFGYPMMLKSATGGYDGKGNFLIRDESQAEDAYLRLGGGAVELMAEEFCDFEREISIIACRGIDGVRVIYPIAENTHRDSILDTTVVPARIDRAAADKAAAIADRVMEVFEGVGTFGIELFLGKDGEIYVNEVAPRPHNSGHYTIEGCFANQFENHIRAITGLPFGNTGLILPTVMVNLLGEGCGEARLLGLEQAYRDNPNLRVHLYGKPESKTARKMGHFTVVDECVDAAIEKAQRAKQILRVVGGAL
ncbi:MAG: 5-(carboxyamino)imidazole ribonucleotide synthase [Oscillospiraceae bacterium]|nr:5-(carboxyamino)imidazole ribonucleotide synthase [Oscillospiraceae bacterium]